MDYDIVSQISTSKKNCRIKVRVVRTWDSIIPPFQNLISTYFLLLDEQENSIQAFARKQEASDFKDLLAEGNVYYLANFNILPNKKSYRAANGKYIIQLTRSTAVNETKDHVDAIPLHKFTFTDFLDISDDNENNVNLIEVIGQIISVGSLTHLYAGPKLTLKRNVEIQNLRKDKLSVTLWDKFATDFDEDAIMNKEKDIPVIIIFIGMTVKTFKEKVYLCTLSASRFYVNLQIPAVKEFHLRLQSQTYQIQLVEEKNQPILTLEEEIATNTKSLAELLKLDWQHFQGTKFTCKAQLKSIDTTYGWWYRACYRCKCAVRNYGETFCCSKCGRNDKPPIPWYKLNTIVEDETATTNFTIFEKLAQDLIQIPASQLATATNADRYTLHL
uniref:Replication protein A 70 kDa DNA-binding subunit B-like n=1 Tax=Ananas comosus var. bracteatus TaxID=296719 RepID=A0A6V7Q1U3_ANACO|nr:unnamed protein product [Ananas comosus var. bracteatus]